jgi:hypothetical protein
VVSKGYPLRTGCLRSFAVLLRGKQPLLQSCFNKVDKKMDRVTVRSLLPVGDAQDHRATDGSRGAVAYARDWNVR